MPFHAYIIRSKSSGRLYKGHTENLKQRLHQHNLGKTKSTKADVPYLTYNSSALNYMLVNAIKEQQTQIEKQQKQIDQLIKRVAVLESKVDE